VAEVPFAERSTRPLEYAVAADFDGDGRDDLAFDEGRQM
jgi:hypothetical protein